MSSAKRKLVDGTFTLATIVCESPVVVLQLQQVCSSSPLDTHRDVWFGPSKTGSDWWLQLWWWSWHMTVDMQVEKTSQLWVGMALRIFSWRLSCQSAMAAFCQSDCLCWYGVEFTGSEQWTLIQVVSRSDNTQWPVREILIELGQPAQPALPWLPPAQCPQALSLEATMSSSEL